MSIEGKLTIDLHRENRGPCSASITSTRPVQIARLFKGKTAQQTLEAIPLLFSVCAKAQSSASVQALERAGRVEVPENTDYARQMIVLAETAREHVLRIALDWSRFLSGKPEQPDVKILMKLPVALTNALFSEGAAFNMGALVDVNASQVRALISGLETFLETRIFSEPLRVWQGRNGIAELKDWAESGDSIPAKLVCEILRRDWADVGGADTVFLPPLADDELERLFRDDSASAFVMPAPWSTTPLETSCLTRQSGVTLIRNLKDRYGTGLLTRLMARLVGLSRLPHQMSDLLVQCETAEKAKPSRSGSDVEGGYGVAQVEAARGRLVHLVELNQGVVQNYSILAPTEWNFHPEGPAACSLSRLHGGDEAELKTQAGLLINAIDPCVGYEVRVV